MKIIQVHNYYQQAGGEDAVLSHAANLVGATAVVTRNTKDFRHSPVKAFDPHEFLSVFE